MRYKTWFCNTLCTCGKPKKIHKVLQNRSLIHEFFIYAFFWVFYPDNIFLVDLYQEMLGPGVKMGSYPSPFGIKISLVSMRNPIFLVARDQASIPGVNRVLSSKKLWMFFVCKWKFSEKHTFFSRSFETVNSSTNSGSHCLSRKCRTYTFNNFSLAKWDSRNGGDLFGRAKIDTVESCIQLLKIVLLYRGHLHKEFSRDFPIFEGMKKFYYRHSAEKCIKYSFDIRARLKTERRLCFPTSDRLETWLFPSGPTWSRQYHQSTMVWGNLPLYHLCKCLLTLCTQMKSQIQLAPWQVALNDDEKYTGGRLVFTTSVVMMIALKERM